MQEVVLEVFMIQQQILPVRVEVDQAELLVFLVVVRPILLAAGEVVLET